MFLYGHSLGALIAVCRGRPDLKHHPSHNPAAFGYYSRGTSSMALVAHAARHTPQPVVKL